HFQQIYNTERPHRAIGRRTPEAVYNTTPKDSPVTELDHSIWRVRYDRVDTAGKVTLRYQGRLRHLHIGRAHTSRRVILLVHNNQTITLSIGTGEILAEHTIDPTKSYQPKNRTMSRDTPQKTGTISRDIPHPKTAKSRDTE